MRPYFKVSRVVKNNIPRYYGSYVSDDGSTIRKENVWFCAPYNENNLKDLVLRTQEQHKQWLAKAIKQYEKKLEAYLVKRREWEEEVVAAACGYATFPSVKSAPGDEVNDADDAEASDYEEFKPPTVDPHIPPSSTTPTTPTKRSKATALSDSSPVIVIPTSSGKKRKTDTELLTVKPASPTKTAMPTTKRPRAATAKKTG
jgi:hypothetical protein